MAEPTWIWTAAAVVSTVLGLAWLALAMDVHWQQVHGGSAPQRNVRLTLRTLGSTALVASALLCAMADRASMAVLVWLMLLAGSIPLIAMTLASRPQLLRVLWPWGSLQGMKR